MPFIFTGGRGLEINMSKNRDSQHREGKKKPDKTLKEKRADKAAKKAGTNNKDSVHQAFGGNKSAS